MKVLETGIEGLIEILPNVFGDNRGYFLESFQKDTFNEIIPNTEFIQDNQSYSTAGVLRGLHFQKGEYAQGKLVRVVLGKVMDVVVDLRKESATFGEHHTFLLDTERHNMVFVPPGFAHGFVTLEPSIFSYKCSNYYNKESEGGLLWNDPALNIDWGIENPLVSDKDQILPTLVEIKDSL